MTTTFMVAWKANADADVETSKHSTLDAAKTKARKVSKTAATTQVAEMDANGKKVPGQFWEFANGKQVVADKAKAEEPKAATGGKGKAKATGKATGGQKDKAKAEPKAKAEKAPSTTPAAKEPKQPVSGSTKADNVDKLMAADNDQLPENLASFNTRRNTNRRFVIAHLLEQKKPISVYDLFEATYGEEATDNLGKIYMVLRGVEVMIEKYGLPFNFKIEKIDKENHVSLTDA